MTEAERRATELPADNQGFHKIVPKHYFSYPTRGRLHRLGC